MNRIEGSAARNAAQVLDALDQLAAGRRGERLRGKGVVSDRVRIDRQFVLRRALLGLYSAGFNLADLKNLSGAHLSAVVAAWRERGLSAASLRTYTGYLKLLCRWLNKPQLIRHLRDEIEPERRLALRSNARTRALNAHRSLEEVFLVAGAVDRRFACILLVMATFGYTARQAWLVRPWRLDVTPDTGEIVSWARSWAGSAQCSMIPPEETLGSWRRRFYRYCRAAQLTEQTSGLTPQLLYHRRIADQLSPHRLLAAARDSSFVC